MAKKKLTKKKKKTRTTTSRKVARKTTGKKSGTARKTSTRKAPAKKAGAGKTTKKKPARKKPARKKPAGKKVTVKKSATRTKKVPAREVGKKTTKKGSTRKKVTGAAAVVTRPDPNGYVIINGRRVRMISGGAEPPPPKKRRVTSRAAVEPRADADSAKAVKTKLNKKELERYRNLLLIQRAELVGDLSTMEAQALQASGGNLSHMPIHMADIGTDTYDQDFMLGLAETERRRLREIDAALQRIDERTYGICQMTSKPIPKTRLNAKPWAKYTIEAARVVEQGLGE